MLTPESGSREIHGELSTGTVMGSLKPFPEVPVPRGFTSTRARARDRFVVSALSSASLVQSLNL